MTALVPLGEADAGCGGKAATLARLLRAGMPVPPGFVVRTPLDEGSWRPRLGTALAALGGGPVAVRSSGVGEDGDAASFAGQLRTALDVAGVAAVAAEVGRVAASASAPSVADYVARTGRALGAVPVLVQRMVHPDAAGVLATRDPLTGAERVVVEAARGLGTQVVDGRVTPERWTVDGSTIDVLARRDAVLTHADVAALAALGRRVEAVLGGPQDVEWALAGGMLHVLQARPLTAQPTPARVAVPSTVRDDAPPDARLLARGTPASPGVATGTVRGLRRLDDLPRFRAGEVLVCETTSPAWTPALARAAAVVTRTGGLLAHAAIVAREFGIPAVLGVPDLGALADGATVRVDGTLGVVTRAEAPSGGAR